MGLATNKNNMQKTYNVLSPYGFAVHIDEEYHNENNWKARMLKAGLSNQGLIIPEDWDTLSEDDKEARLNKVITQLT